jgi:GNAT superfamily N-acetyltransferase
MGRARAQQLKGTVSATTRRGHGRGRTTHDTSSKTRARSDLSVEGVRAIFERKSGRWRTDITRQRVRKDGTTVSEVTVLGRIFYDEREVGYYTRSIYDHDSGERIANHQDLYLQKAYRGRGFASAFNAAAENHYRELDVDVITVGVSGSVGGYTWARAGFIFEGDLYRQASSAELIWRRKGEAIAQRLLRQGKISQTLYELACARKLAHDVSFYNPRRRVDDADLNGRIHTPQQILDLGRVQPWDERGQSMWLGKKILLSGGPWFGQKRLV